MDGTTFASAVGQFRSGNYAPCVVGVVSVLAFVVALSSCRRRALPGKLKPRGSFQYEDPANRQAIDERKRDFARIVSTRRDFWHFTPTESRPGTVVPIDPPVGVSVDQAGTVAYNRFKFYLQGELSKIPGCVDLGSTSEWQVVDRVVYFVSASPGFDFVMGHRVQPSLLQAKFLVMVSKSGQVRVAWYAFATDKVVPGATSGPFVIKLVSEDLRADRGGRSHSEYTYTATQTGEKDMERLIARHAPLIAKGIASDVWDPYLKA